MKIDFNISRDKRLHIIVGLMIFAVTTMFFNHFIGIIVTVVLAFLKELNDGLKVIPFLLSKSKSTFSLKDLFASIIIPLIIASIMNL